MNMTAEDRTLMIARLQESKTEEDAESKSDGIEAGKSRARNDARHGELKRLARWWDSQTERERECALTTADDAYDAQHRLAEVICGRHLDRAEAAEFWEIQGFDDDPLEDAYLLGFAEGAVDDFKEVKAEL